MPLNAFGSRVEVVTSYLHFRDRLPVKLGLRVMRISFVSKYINRGALVTYLATLIYHGTFCRLRFFIGN